LREVFARSDHDFGFPEPARRKPRHPKGVSGAFLRFVRLVHHAADYPNRIAGTLLVGLVIAICINALVLQQSRHPAPLFRKSIALPLLPSQPPEDRQAATAAATAAASARPASDPISQLLQSSAAQSVSDPGKAGLSRRTGAKDGAKPSDPISQLLKSQAAESTEQSRTVLAAQRALVKLGFVLKPDGLVGGATRQAIEQFERDRGLPEHGELSPKILHELSAESGIAIE